MKHVMIALVTGITLAGVAQAEPIAAAAAKSMLFDAAEAQVQIISGGPLSEDEAKLLTVVVADQPFFGAIAVSPDEKLLESKATIAVANFHSTEAASAEALRQCDALRTGKSACVVVALIRPKGWEKRSLSLSSDATAGFVKDYPKSAGALAISGSTGAWGIAVGPGAADAAVKACAAKSADTDCRVVVAD